MHQGGRGKVEGQGWVEQRKKKSEKEMERRNTHLFMQQLFIECWGCVDPHTCGVCGVWGCVVCYLEAVGEEN